MLNAVALGVLGMTGAAAADPLDALLWRARPLVIVAPDAADARLARQKLLLDARRSALKNYDIDIVAITGDTPFRRRWNVAPDAFAVVLVGKDGGEKARWQEPVDPAKIFAEIDTMPMRRQEVRGR